MGTRPPGVLRVGDRVHFDGAEHHVVGIAGTSVRVRSTAPATTLIAQATTGPSPAT